MKLRDHEHDLVRIMAESFIRTAARIADTEKIEAQLRKNPHPVFLPVMDAILKDLEKIEHKRDRDLLRDLVLLMFWKMQYSNSFTQPALSIMKRLSGVLPGLPYDQYCKEVGVWKINRYASHLMARSPEAYKEENRSDGQRKA